MKCLWVRGFGEFCLFVICNQHYSSVTFGEWTNFKRWTITDWRKLKGFGFSQRRKSHFGFTRGLEEICICYGIVSYIYLFVAFSAGKIYEGKIIIMLWTKLLCFSFGWKSSQEWCVLPCLFPNSYGFTYVLKIFGTVVYG